MRHLIRKIKRLYKWIPILVESEPWDYAYLINMICHKIQDMHDFNSSKDAVAVHSKKELRRMKEVLCHFKHFQDMFEYMEVDNCEHKWVDSENGMKRLETKTTRRYKYQIERMTNLEKWHLQEAFRKMGKYISNWWD